MTMLGGPWRSRVPLLAAVLLSACAEDVSRGGDAQVPTRMLVQPEDFLGEVPCLEASGAMRSYQVTILDVTEGLPGEDLDEPFALPTSSIVPCEVSVGFQFVAAGHRYVAEVAGFTAEPEDLQQPTPGFPAVVDGSGRVVAPRWTTTCHGTNEALSGSGEGGAGGAGGASTEQPRGALAVANAQVPIRGCEPLLDAGESPTGIVVRLDPALSNLRCGDGAGEISSFVVSGPDLPAGTFSAACGDAAVVSPLPPDQDVIVEVVAQGPADAGPGVGGAGGAGGAGGTDATMSWTTRCQARTAAGALVPASCEPLVPSGSP